MFENFLISKFVYDSPLYYIRVSQTLNSNNSANSKQNLKILLVVFNKKNGGEKNRETVPLRIRILKEKVCTRNWQSKLLRGGGVNSKLDSPCFVSVCITCTVMCICRYKCRLFICTGQAISVIFIQN